MLKGGYIILLQRPIPCSHTALPIPAVQWLWELGMPQGFHGCKRSREIRPFIRPGSANNDCPGYIPPPAKMGSVGVRAGAALLANRPYLKQCTKEVWGLVANPTRFLERGTSNTPTDNKLRRWLPHLFCRGIIPDKKRRERNVVFIFTTR